MNKFKNADILISREEIIRLDTSNMMGSIRALADQVRHAWEDTKHLDFELTREVHNVIVAGMGGSGLGPDIFKHLYVNQLNVPFEIYNGYTLPAYVDETSLVILASYSGTTEEVLSCAEQASQAYAQVLVIAAGGDLIKLGQENNYPYYQIDPVHNPSNQPRMAIGYTVFGVIGLLVKAGLVQISDQEIEEVITTITKTSEKLEVGTSQETNRAKMLAVQTIERRPIIVGSEFLVGAIHTATNQFNENAKIFADYKVVPELNHHLMEGLKFPNSNDTSHFFIFIQSELYHPRNQKRIELSKQVVEKNGIETMTLKLESGTKLTQVFELITLMSYANFYVSIIEGIDPSPIPFVDWFKNELAKE